jgi:cytochrome c-type biogenesis protein CcmH/NrfG
LKEAEKNTVVKKQTLAVAVILALCIGFLGGTIYSSVKLVSDQQMPGNALGEDDHTHDEKERMAEYAAKILQLEQYLEKNATDAEAWAQLGNLFFDTDQVKEAIAAYEKSLTIQPDVIEVITDLGVMYRRNSQPDKAIAAFDRAIAIKPDFETARFNKGIVLLHDLNDVEGGIKAWEEIVEQNPMAMAPNGESVDALVQRMKKKN